MKTPVVVEQQVSEARRFWRNRQIRTALIVPWAEAYTGAFIMPVFAYFMQGLGLQATEMGMLRATQLVLNAASAPFCGYLLDRHGPWLGIALPSSLCAIGCGIRACANSFSGLFTASIFSGLSGAKIDMAVAHLSRHSAPTRRTLAVSAAKVQMQTLTLFGTLCFTPLDALLRFLLPAERFGMLRFRVEISLCVIGCGFGVLMLLLAKDVMSYETTSTAAGGDATRSIVGANGKAEDDEEALDPTECAPVCRAASASGRDVGGVDGGVDGGKGGQLSAEPPPSPATPLSGSAASTPPPATGATDLDGGGSWWALICPCALGKEGRPPAVLVFAFVGLFFASTFRDLQRISWPLFIKAHFGWSEREYGLLLPLNQGAAFCLAATHWLHERIGSATQRRPHTVPVPPPPSRCFYVFRFGYRDD